MEKQGKTLRLSAERFSLSDDLVMICLPEWFRAALLDMTHRMLWSRVWTYSDDSERILSENDKQRIEYGIFQLSQEECDMQIINNVNVTCGGCDGTSTPTTLYCVLPDGTPVITPQPPAPTEPTVPGGGTLPLDPNTDDPPEGFTDWSEFETYACALANTVWWFAHYMVTSLVSIIDASTVVAVLLTLLIPLLPAGVIAAIGGITLLDIIWQLVQIGALSQAGDIMSEIENWLEDNRTDIICFVYQARYSYSVSQTINLGIWAADYLELSLVLSPEERNIVEKFITNLFNFTVFWGFVADKLSENFGLDTTFPAYDCTNCAADIVWTHNTSNGNGTWDITYQSTNGQAVIASGTSPTAGSTQIQAFLSLTGLASNVLGAAVIVNVNEISSTLAADVNLSYNSQNIATLNASGFYGERWLIYNSGYAGPTGGFDRLLPTGNANAIGVKNNSNPDEPASSIIGLGRTAVPQTQTTAVINIYGLTVLDTNGVTIWSGE